MIEEQLALPGLPSRNEITPPQGGETPRLSRRERRRIRRAHQESARPEYDPSQGWHIPVQVMDMGDGTYSLRAGRPVQRGNTESVARATGVHRKVLHRLADIGLLTRLRPTPFTSIFYYAEIEALLDRTKNDPNFWDEIKREAYLQGKTLQDSGVK